MKTYKTIAKKGGQRIDQALAELLPDLSRRALRRLIDVGAVYKNNQRVRVASRMVDAGDHLTVHYEADAAKKIKAAQQMHLQAEQVLLLNDDLLVLHKPAGIPSQATMNQSVLHMERLANDFLKVEKLPGKAILTHRLDKETSGVLVFARNDEYARHLFAMFKEKKVIKRYLAIVHGCPNWESMEVNNLLCGLTEGKGTVRVVSSGGKSALTKFKKIWSDRERNLSFIQAEPLTGRSHQIRVHLSGLGFPIVGDKKYIQDLPLAKSDEWRAQSLSRHMLHAWKLAFPDLGEKFDYFFICQPDGVFAELAKPHV